MLRFVVAALVVLATPAFAGSAATTSGFPAGPEVAGLCFQNVFGVGTCGAGAEVCDSLQECNVENPCPDGKICQMETCCASSLGGVCGTPIGDNPACGNPGSCDAGFAGCEPVLVNEDFSAVTVDEITVCGTGAQMFVEDDCAGSAFATSPLDHGRWGVAAGSCGFYAGSSSRVWTGPGSVDISSCAGSATLEFDYLLDLNEGGAFDRAFVTVEIDGGLELVVASNQLSGQQAFTTQSLSCAGGVVPMGRLIQDGSWRHFRHPLGTGASANVRFYGEVYDGILNAGQGWLFEDFRIGCTELVYENDFESANFLAWSDTTAPLPLVTISEAPGSCPGGEPNFKPCDGPEGACLNFQTAEGPTLCLNVGLCGASCTASSDCAAGWVCIVQSCCETPVCTRAQCDPEEGLLFLPASADGAEAVATTAGPRRLR